MATTLLIALVLVGATVVVIACLTNDTAKCQKWSDPPQPWGPSWQWQHGGAPFRQSASLVL